MILLLIPLAGIVLGVVLWAVLRGAGALNVLGVEGRVARPVRGTVGPRSSGVAGLRERVEDIPQGCLIAVVVVTGLWILSWLIVLIVGLSILS